MLKDKEFLSRFFKVSFPVMLHALILFIVNLVDMVMVSNIEGQVVQLVQFMLLTKQHISL